MSDTIGFNYVTGESGVHGRRPSVWAGTADRDGDAEPWLSAPLGSQYTYINGTTSAKMYVKIADAGEDADWADTTD